MNAIMDKWGREVAPIVRRWWAPHSLALFRLAVAVLSVAAPIWLGYEFWRLVLYSGKMGAIDLRHFYGQVERLFAGLPVYITEARPWSDGYPPASFAMLFPFLGWLDFQSARWLWAFVTVVSLGGWAYLLVQQSGATTGLERVFVALMLLGTYPAGATIGNGQLGTLLIPLLVSGILLIQRHRAASWKNDLLAAILLLFALIKPNLTIPFFWLVLFVPGRLRPISLVAVGYVGVTLFAASFQPDPLWVLLRDAFRVDPNAVLIGGVANIANWLAALGLWEWSMPAAFLILMLLGLWVFWNRQVEIWLLLGVTAIVARFWMVHRWYDDLLMLLPLITLFRIARSGPVTDGSDVVAGGLFAITLATLLAPGGLYLLPPPWSMLYVALQTAIWFAVLLFLLYYAAKGRMTKPTSS